MTSVVLSTLFTHWRVHGLQLATLILGLALATALWTAVQAINAEARASYAASESEIKTLSESIIISNKIRQISLSRFAVMRRQGWDVAPVLRGRWRFASGDYDVVGIDVLNPPPSVQGFLTGVSDTFVLDALTNPRILLAEETTAKGLRNAGLVAEVITSPQLPPGTLLTDMRIAEELLESKGILSEVHLRDRDSLAPFLQEFPDVTVQAPAPPVDYSALTASFHLNLTAFGFLSFAVGLFIVHSTIGLAFLQRQNLIRTLRTLGTPLVTLTGAMIVELLLVAVLSGAAGIMLGYGMAHFLLPTVGTTVSDLYGAEISTRLELRPQWIVSSFTMAILGTAAASLQALWHLHKAPLLSHRPVSGDKGAGKPNRGCQPWIGLFLLACGVVTSLVMPNLIGGFALMAGLLLGSALLLPFVLVVLITAAQKQAKSALSQWVWADMRAQIPNLSLALMALLMALSANIGVNTMTSSFRLTFVGWLDQRLFAQIYLRTDSDALGDRVEAWLHTQSIDVLPIRYVETKLGEYSGRLYGIADDDLYRNNWPLVAAAASPWTGFHLGNGIFINEQLANKANVWPGNVITIPEIGVLPVLAVYSDYGNPGFQAMIAHDRLSAGFDNLPNRRFAVKVSREQVDFVSRSLREFFQDNEIQITSQEQSKAASLRIFDRTFVITDALGVLLFAVSGFALFTSFLSVSSQRMQQVSPMWAMGVTRSRLMQLELVKGLGLAAMTALLAIPLGLLLSWVLLAVVNVHAFGWRLPMFLFPMDWVRLVALALAMSALAVLAPALRLRRASPADLLRGFENDR